MRDKHSPERPTTEMYIADIIENMACGRHSAQKGLPCWRIKRIGSGDVVAICNRRARKAGYDHAISEKSLRMNRISKR